MRSGAVARSSALLSLYRPAFLDKLEYASYDALLRAARTHPPGGDVVIVDVDERSLSSVGQWPWRRDLVGNLVDPYPRSRRLDHRARHHVRGVGPVRRRRRGDRPGDGRCAAPRPGRARLRADVRQRVDAVERVRAAPARPRRRAPGRRADARSVLPGHGRRLQPPGPDAGGRRLGISERRPGPRRPSQARAPAGGVRRPGLSGARARGGHCGEEHARRQPAGQQRERGLAVVRQPERAARRQEQPAAPLSGPPADVPVRVGRRHPERRGRRRRLQEQDRVRRHDGARHPRSGVDAARHAVCRRRGAGHRGRQPAAAGLHPPARVRHGDRDAGRAGRRHLRVAARRALRPRLGRRDGRRLPRGRVGRRRRADGGRTASFCRRSIRRSVSSPRSARLPGDGSRSSVTGPTRRGTRRSSRSG